MVDIYAPLVQDQEPLNEVKFAARDYTSIFDSILRRLKLKYELYYNDYATTVQGIMFAEMCAYAVAELQWYLDRTASDCFLDTARTRAAVNRIVKEIGYKMRPAAAASDTLTVTFTDGTTGPFTMPARWRFQGPGGLVYESVADLVEPAALAPGTVRDILVRQGDTRLLTYTANGTQNQEYRLSAIDVTRYLADQSCEVWVDGLEWTERPFLTFVADGQFEADYLDDPPRVRFGDGIAGLVPALGSEVKIRYVITDGIRGNEPKAGSITTVLDTLTVGGTAVAMTVTNALAPNGGSDPEDIESARKLAPVSFAARGAAITEPDYQALSNSFVDPLYGSVSKAYAFNPRAAYEDIVFNAYIAGVTALLNAYVIAVTAEETAANTAAAALTPVFTAIRDQMTALETVRATDAANIAAAKATLQGARNSCTTAEAGITTTTATLGAVDVGLDTLLAYVQANLAPGAVRTSIEAQIATLLSDTAMATSQVGAAGVAIAAAGPSIDLSISTFLNAVLEHLTGATATPPDTTIPIVIATVESSCTAGEAQVVALQLVTASMVGQAGVLQTDVFAYTTDMHTRIGELFSDDCMSNYVQVPILAVDADGNYVAPSVGIITALQTYLDGIKEVTQQVEVVDGYPVLALAAIHIDLSVGEAYVYDEVAAKVQSTVLAMLKGRDFDQPLWLSDLYENVQGASPGVAHVNIQITGPIEVPSVIDADGNLVPGRNRIVALGSLEIDPA